MSLYPSLEDMKVDEIIQSQVSYMKSSFPSAPPVNTQENPTAPILQFPSYYDSNQSTHGSLYPGLGEYMGLEFSSEVIAANMPEYSKYMQVSKFENIKGGSSVPNNTVAPISGTSVGLQRAQVTGQVRKITLCKDAKGKIGLKVSAVNKGIFVVLVQSGSAASLGGLRFGDQILQINNINVAGYSSDKVHKLLRECPVDGIELVIRDRPFERTITLHKDSYDYVGFQFKNGKVTAIVKDSSAARNGLLTDHHLLEVNGQNVVGLKDKDITKVINSFPSPITITIIPSFIYDHMMKSVGSSLTKLMDRSVPDV